MNPQPTCHDLDVADPAFSMQNGRLRRQFMTQIRVWGHICWRCRRPKKALEMRPPCPSSSFERPCPFLLLLTRPNAWLEGPPKHCPLLWPLLASASTRCSTSLDPPQKKPGRSKFKKRSGMPCHVVQPHADGRCSLETPVANDVAGCLSGWLCSQGGIGGQNPRRCSRLSLGRPIRRRSHTE